MPFLRVSKGQSSESNQTLATPLPGALNWPPANHGDSRHHGAATSSPGGFSASIREVPGDVTSNESQGNEGIDLPLDTDPLVSVCNLSVLHILFGRL